MSPYLAILTDSFRAALASRVLWIVLGLILLLLLALAPIGLRSTLITDFDISGISDRNQLIQVWGEALRDPTDTAARRLARELPAELQVKLTDATGEPAAEPSGSDSASTSPRVATDNPSTDQGANGSSKEAGAQRISDAELVAGLNRLLNTDQWYDEELWKSTTRLREQRGLEGLAADQLSADQQRRLRRLRIEGALTSGLNRSQAEELALTYLGIDTPVPIPRDLGATRERVLGFVQSILVPTMLKLFLGIAAIFVAVLVTAPIIPEMFQEGSLHLLLSKPLRRPLLFLTKYIGGCAFVLVCVSLLVVGLWLILGFRLGLWNHRLLLAIPMFLAMFAIYYSVSAFAGVVWRNATVAIAAVMVFWAISASVRYVLSGVMEAAAGLQNRVVRVLPSAQGQAVTGTAFGRVQRWNPADRSWSTMIDGGIFQPLEVLGPVEVNGEWFGSQNNLQGGPPQGSTFDGPLRKYLPQEGVWDSVLGPDLPGGTRQLLPWNPDRLLVVTDNGLLVADPSKFAERKPASSQGMLNDWFTRLTQPVANDFFTPLEVVDEQLSNPLLVRGSADEQVLIWVDDARVLRLEASDGKKLRRAAIHEVPVDLDDQRGLRRRLIGASETTVAYIQQGELIALDADDLQVRHRLPLARSSATQLSLAEDVAVVLDGEGNADSYDLRDGRRLSGRWPYGGNISTLAADGAGGVWIAHDLNALARFDAKSRELLDSAPTHGGWWVRLYNWVYRPVSRYFPQPAELNGPMDRLIAGSQVAERNAQEAAELGVSSSFWRPVLVNLGFTVLMLALGCWYVSRQDF
jgi:ABC-type transport system involved in multi-copper enzyme maturation permease subunit